MLPEVDLFLFLFKIFFAIYLKSNPNWWLFLTTGKMNIEN